MVVRHFLVYLGAEYPHVIRLKQLHRDPHILGWMACLRAQTPPLATATCIGRLFALRTILNELAWANKLPDLAQLLRREDIPRTPHTLPRPLTAEQDQLLEQEFLRRNDLGGNVFLLLRRTGMRIGSRRKLRDLAGKGQPELRGRRRPGSLAQARGPSERTQASNRRSRRPLLGLQALGRKVHLGRKPVPGRGEMLSSIGVTCTDAVLNIRG
jgi:hypothetical protein